MCQRKEEGIGHRAQGTRDRDGYSVFTNNRTF